KSGLPRTLKLHPRVYEALQTIWQDRSCPNFGRVFVSTRGEPYADTRTHAMPGGNPLKSAHRTACLRAGVTGFRLHDWRHYWASWMVMSGADLITVQRMGGWKDLRMVQRYAALSTAHMAEAVERFQAGRSSVEQASVQKAASGQNPGSGPKALPG